MDKVTVADILFIVLVFGIIYAAVRLAGRSKGSGEERKKKEDPRP